MLLTFSCHDLYYPSLTYSHTHVQHMWQFTVAESMAKCISLQFQLKDTRHLQKHEYRIKEEVMVLCCVITLPILLKCSTDISAVCPCDLTKDIFYLNLFYTYMTIIIYHAHPMIFYLTSKMWDKHMPKTITAVANSSFWLSCINNHTDISKETQTPFQMLSHTWGVTVYFHWEFLFAWW